MKNIKHPLCAAAALLLLTGCGSSSSDSSAPNVSSVTPGDQAIDVALDSTISATFNEDILATSISENSFTLSDNDAVAGTVSFDALSNTVTFTPTDRLSLQANYTATLSTAISDLSGNALSQDYSWSFTTVDGSLNTTAENVEFDDTNYLGNPAALLFDNGNGVAIWKVDFNPTRIWTSHYTSGAGWNTPEQLQLDTTVNGELYQLARNDNGDAVAIWSEDRSNIIMKRYNSETQSWGSAITITEGQANAVGPQVAINDNGDMIVVWMQGAAQYTIDDVWAKQYDATNDQWSIATNVTNVTNEAGDITKPIPAIDADGNGIIGWRIGQQLNVTHYSTSEGWGTKTTVVEAGENSQQLLDLNLDNNGNVLFIWLEFWNIDQVSYSDLWYHQYDAETGWGAATRLEEHDEYVGLPSIAANTNGVVMVTWRKEDTTTNIASFISRTYTPGEGWGPEETFDYSAYQPYNHVVAIDNEGNALLSWQFEPEEFNGNKSDLWFNRYVAGSGWGTATEPSTIGNEYGDHTPNVSTNSSGEGMLIFGGNSDTGKGIYSRVFK